MTNHWVDIKNANVIIVMGGNAAEAHPCGFKWVTEAKAHNHATFIVADPRFTRTSTHHCAQARTSPSWAG